jgi:hypothetical protein
MTTLQASCQAALSSSVENRPAADERLLQLIDRSASESLLWAEFQRIFKTDPLCAQYGLRLARAAHSKIPFGDGTELLLSAFCLVVDPAKAPLSSVLTLGQELFSWTSANLVESAAKARCFVSPSPKLAQDAQRCLSSSLRRIAMGLATGGHPSSFSCHTAEDPLIAMVWPIVLKGSSSYCDRTSMDLLLKKPTPDLLSFKHRVEERYPFLTFLGVYNWSDACSFSKLGALRMFATRSKADSFEIHENRDLTLFKGVELIKQFSLSEETPADVEGALRKVGLTPCEPHLSKGH